MRACSNFLPPFHMSIIVPGSFLVAGRPARDIPGSCRQGGGGGGGGGVIGRRVWPPNRSSRSGTRSGRGGGTSGSMSALVAFSTSFILRPACWFTKYPQVAIEVHRGFRHVPNPL